MSMHVCRWVDFVSFRGLYNIIKVISHLPLIKEWGRKANNTVYQLFISDPCIIRHFGNALSFKWGWGKN